MHERKIFLVNDDTNNETSLKRLKELDPLFKPTLSIIITDDPHFPSVEEFAGILTEKYPNLNEKPKGLHLNFFSGQFPENSQHLFGNHGILRFLLTLNESYQTHSSRINNLLYALTEQLVSKAKPQIIQEIQRQHNLFTQYFGSDDYMTYHFGIHHLHPLYCIYQDTAFELGIPHRAAIKYNDYKNGTTPDAFHDTVNHETVSKINFEDILLRLIPGINEVCLHLGDSYGNRQLDILNKLSSKIDPTILHTTTFTSTKQ